jgi:hypothetical protein
MRVAGWPGVIWFALALPCAAVGEAATTSYYTLVDGSTFQRGCFAPCECPIGQEQPLAGVFALAPVSDNGLFAEYSMSDVRWNVEGNSYATPPNAAITGSGTYTIGGEFAIQQQMQADLSIAGATPEHFDSGRVVGGGGFPDQIDIEISEHGKVCFDTVIHVVAQAADCGSAATYCPEPNGIALLASGAGALALLYRRKAGSAFGSSRPT